MKSSGRRRAVVLGLGVAVAAAAGVADVGCGTSGAPPAAHAFPVWEMTLPSGLRVVIERDDTSGLAGVVAIVDAGQVDDPPGKVGLAHVVEHLMFRVPDASGRSMWNRLFTLGAASFNAETAVERTTYHAFGPGRALDDLLALVLGRLADPLRGATAAHVEKEVAITAEEMRRREGASGYELLMPALLPATNPAARAFAEIRRSDPLTLDDARAFTDRHYRPERMTVVISGPIPDGWEKGLAAKLPAALRGSEAQRRAPVRRPAAPFEGPARGEAALPPHAAKVNGPELWMAWRLPPVTGLGAKNLEVMGRIVDIVLSGRLSPEGTNDVIDVDAWSVPGNLSSAIVCRVKLRAAADGVRIRDEMRTALQALADPTLVHIKGRLWWGYVRAVQIAALSTALGMESIEGRALARAGLVHAGSGALISGVLESLEKVSVEDVSTFAARHLAPEAARAVLLVPEDATAGARAPAPAASGAGPSAGSGVEGEPEPGSRPGEPAPELPANTDLRAIVQPPGARAAVVRTLRNGLTVIALRRPGLPFESVRLGFHADPQPSDAPGAWLAVSRSRSWTLAEGPAESGILYGTDQYPDSFQETLRLFSSNQAKALGLLSDEADTMHLFWPNPALDRWIADAEMREATPEDRAERTFRRALYAGHPYDLRPAAATVRKIAEKQAEAWLARVRRPANGALVVVGEIDPEGVVRDAERALGGWKGAPDAPPPPPAPPVARPRAQMAPPVVRTDDPRRGSAELRFGCFVPPVRARRDQIADALLSNLITSDLFNRLRDELAVTYSPHVHSQAVRGGTAWLDGRFDIDGPSVQKGLDLLGRWFDRARPIQLDGVLVERLRWDMARSSSLDHANGGDLARALFDVWNMGWAPAVLDDFAADLAGITIPDLAARLEACRATAVISVLSRGKD